MFGFKRKKEEDTMALVLKKKNIFSKIASLFRKNKQEELGEYYSNQVFYSRHSDVINAINNAGEEVFYGTVSMNGLDMYSFQKIKELGLIKDGNGQTTKLIVADLNQSYNQEGLEPQNLRKICSNAYLFLQLLLPFYFQSTVQDFFIFNLSTARSFPQKRNHSSAARFMTARAMFLLNRLPFGMYLSTHPISKAKNSATWL